MAETIVVETQIQAAVEAVWKAYTTPEAIVVWNTASPDWHTTRATVDLRVGGEFSSRMEAKDGSFGFDFAGTYTRIEPLRAIEYAFGDRKATIDFLAKDGAMTVRVSFEAESQNPVDMQRQGWQAILDNFARYVLAHP